MSHLVPQQRHFILKTDKKYIHFQDFSIIRTPQRRKTNNPTLGQIIEAVPTCILLIDFLCFQLQKGKESGFHCSTAASGEVVVSSNKQLPTSLSTVQSECDNAQTDTGLPRATAPPTYRQRDVQRAQLLGLPLQRADPLFAFLSAARRGGPIPLEEPLPPFIWVIFCSPPPPPTCGLCWRYLEGEQGQGGRKKPNRQGRGAEERRDRKKGSLSHSFIILVRAHYSHLTTRSTAQFSSDKTAAMPYIK